MREVANGRVIGIDGCQAENDGDELTVKLKDVRKEVERGEIVLKYPSCQPFCLGMRRSPASVAALWRYSVWQLFLCVQSNAPVISVD